MDALEVIYSLRSGPVSGKQLVAMPVLLAITQARLRLGELLLRRLLGDGSLLQVDHGCL